MSDGVSSGSIPVTILEDDEPEVDEVFIVRLVSVVLLGQLDTDDPPVLGKNRFTVFRENVKIFSYL